MDMREAFEAAISASPYERSVARFPNDEERFSWPGAYQDIDVDLAWRMWQAAYKAGMADGRMTEMQRSSDSNHELLDRLRRLRVLPT